MFSKGGSGLSLGPVMSTCNGFSCISVVLDVALNLTLCIANGLRVANIGLTRLYVSDLGSESPYNP